MTSLFDVECPLCGAGGYNEGYCWDCGYDSEVEPNLIDQPEPDEDDIYE